MYLDLTDLRLFLHVLETGSITAGAARSGLALASASARVRGMEDQVGVPLLERGRRGVQPTAAGRALLHHARLVTEQVGRMRGELGEYARGLTGHVRVLANTVAGAEFLPEPLAGFLHANPAIDVEVEERPSAEISAALLEGRADLGVAADHADATGLESVPFRLDRLVLVVPPGHALAGAGSVAFADALGGDFVGLAGDSALQAHLLGHALRAGMRMRLRARVRSLDAVCRMVAAGAGAAVAPEAAAARWAGRLAAVGLSDSWAERRLSLLARRFDALPAYARRLAEHLAGDHSASGWRDGAASAKAGSARQAASASSNRR